MSLTKRLIDSLSQAEQDAILGAHNPDERRDGPTVNCSDCRNLFVEIELHNGLCAGCCFKRPNYWESEPVEINGLNEPTEHTTVGENFQPIR